MNVRPALDGDPPAAFWCWLASFWTMATDVEVPPDLPESLAEVLDQHDPETILAVHEYSERLLAAYDLEEELENRTYG